MNDIATAGIPANVLKQGQRSDEIIAQIAKGEAVTVVEEKPVEKPAASGKPAEPAKKPEASEAPESTWQGRYIALKGKYDAEVPRLAEQLSELQETARRQQGTIDTLLKTIEGAGGAGGSPRTEQVIDEAGKAPTHTKAPKLLNKDAFAGYGEEVQDMLDVINAQSREIADLKVQLGSVATTVQTTTQNTFYTELKALCPHWEKLNKHVPFLTWLDERDTPRSRTTRAEDIKFFEEKQDAAGVAQFFNDWIRESGWTPERGAAGSKAELSEEIVPAPDVHRDAGADDASKRLGFSVVTKEQLAKATRDRVANRITEEEFNRISDNFQRTYAAIRAGKISL